VIRSALLGCLSVLLACGGGAGNGAGNPARTAEPTVSGAYSYSVPNSTELSVYAVIVNPGGRPDTLVHVQTPDAAGVMYHRYVQDGNLLRMEHLASLAVPARDSLVLEPGGLHLMLTAGRRPRSPGDTLHMSFRFSSGANVIVPVLEPGAEPPPRR
jgi:periplasmic copper chaperone A